MTILLRTVEQLRDHIKSITGENVITDDDLIWLNARYQADSISECSSKDIARMFLDGIKPYNQISDVQDMLDIIYEDDDEGQETRWNLHLQRFVADHFGMEDLAEQLQEQLDLLD